MQATFYINHSDMRYLNKTLTDAKNVDIILKDNVDDARPVIVVSSSAIDKGYNYIYLPTFNRYYAVASKEYSQQKYILHLQRDSKASFKSELLSCDCYAVRSSNKFNTYLNDNRYPHLQFSNPIIKKFPNGFNNHLSAVLTIAGGAGV